MENAAETESWIGKDLGVYRIVRKLGEGGMARVYLVSHTRLPKRFALKLIANTAGAPSDFAQRFRREAETLASLYHPNLVVVFDWNITEEERATLGAWVKQGAALK